MFRTYRDTDLNDCINLVNQVWRFDKHIQPTALSALFQSVYVTTSLNESNYRLVIEEAGRVRGFLFGFIKNQSPPFQSLKTYFQPLVFLRNLLRVKGVSLQKKWDYIHQFRIHEQNRLKVEPEISSEVKLFIVDPDRQGRGWGKDLLWGFIQACQENHENRIILETDQSSNYRFYERNGFTRINSFFSPMQKTFSGQSGETYLYEMRL